MKDIYGKRNIFYAISAAIILLTVISAFVFHVRVDVQFKGGSIITYSYSGELDIAKAQSVIEGSLGESVSIRDSVNQITNQRNIIVTLAAARALPTEALQSLTAALVSAFPDNSIVQEQVNAVDPSMGRSFLVKSAATVVLASIFLLIYVAFRFKRIGGWPAGMTSILAVVLDVIAVFFAFIIFSMPIDDNFVAVVLTILGYALNDTIVVYDRIRENKKLMGSKATNEEIVNTSIRQTFRRSLIISASIMLSMVAVSVIAVLYRVNSILSFSIPLMIGIASGFYTSMFVAPTLWVTWRNRAAKKRATA